MADFNKIKRNIDQMLLDNKSDEEIEAYIASEGLTKKQVIHNMPMTKDLAKSAVGGAVEGVAAIPRLLAAPMGSSVRQSVESLVPGIADYEPATKTGEYVKSGAAGVSAGAVGGPLGMGTGLAGGLAGQGMADAFPEQAGLARLGGNLLGGGIAGLPTVVKGSGAMSRQVRAATRGLKAPDWAGAESLIALANKLGIRLTGPEALGPKAPALLAKQLQAEQAPRSAQIMNEVMHSRPQQVRSAVQAQNAQIGQRYDDPALLGRTVTKEAEGKIRSLEKARTEAVAPLYDLAMFDKLPPDEAQSFLRQIADLRAKDKTGAFAPQLNYLAGLLTESKARPAVPPVRTPVAKPGQTKPIYAHQAGAPASPAQAISDIDNLSRARRVIQGRVELPPFAADAVDKETAAAINAVTARLDESMRRNSPAYSAAQAQYAQLSPGVVARQEGALGDIAKAGTPAEQFERLISAQLMTPTSVRSAADDLRRPPSIHQKQGPGGDTAYEDLMRYGIDQTFDKSQRALQGGGEEFVGARFARAMRKTPQLDDNMREAMRQLPNGASIEAGYKNLLDVLQATGNRLPVGSRTAFNKLQLEDMTSGVIKDTLDPRNVFTKAIFNAWDNMNTRDWAKLFTDKESVKKLRKMSMMNPRSDAAKVLAASILSSMKAPEEESLTVQ